MIPAREESGPPPGRLTVAILGFENRTGDPGAGHWAYLLERLLASELAEVKAVRSRGGAEFARRELGLARTGALDPVTARRMGELIETQRVVWGCYRRLDDERWEATAYVLNVAAGEPSAALTATSADWLEVRDRLIERLLGALGVSPSPEERQRMRRFDTTPAALEWYAKAYGLQAEKKPLAGQENCIRKALAEDPEFVQAHVALGAILFNAGKLDEAEAAARHAMALDSGDTRTHMLLGVLLMWAGKHDEAERELLEVRRLRPDDPRTLGSLAQLYGLRKETAKAIEAAEDAVKAEPTDADSHAFLGYYAATLGRREEAIRSLREAARLDPDSLGCLQFLSQGYELLGETTLAIDSYERLLEKGRADGRNPAALATLERRLRALEDSVRPTPVDARRPRAYSSGELREALESRLEEQDLRHVVDPIEADPAMERWAAELVAGAGSSDLEKATALFAGLTRRVRAEGKGGTRTAKEVFAAWSDPDEPLSCQEYARIYIALGRTVGLDTYYVHLERDYRDEPVYHDCAAVFVDGRAYLVDPAYRWFGAPHRDFDVLDDVETVAHHLFQASPGGQLVERCRVAVKLDTDLAWGQLALANALVSDGQIDEARVVVRGVEELEPGRWDTLRLWGIIALREELLSDAGNLLREAIRLNPRDAFSHFLLGVVLGKQRKYAEARESFRTVRRLAPESGRAAEADRAIARINEIIGAD